MTATITIILKTNIGKISLIWHAMLKEIKQDYNWIIINNCFGKYSLNSKTITKSMNIAYVAAVSMETYSYIVGLPGMLIVKLRNRFHKYSLPQ